MGQKVNPISFRTPYIRPWNSRWYAHKRDYGKLLNEDADIRTYIRKTFASAGVSRVDIERSAGVASITLHTSRPGVIIGRKGVEIDRLRDHLQSMTGKEIQVNIKEVSNPAVDAQLVAENVAFQLVRRIAFRRAMKKTIQSTMDNGAKGVKIQCAGRLGGAEMSRRESYKLGKVPLQTIRADIDYGFAEARTSYGTIGVKVWIYHGDALLDRQPEDEPSRPGARFPARGGGNQWR